MSHSKKHAHYVNLLPPCNNACAAGENTQAWLALARINKFKEAWEEIVKNNPLPAIHGRVCYHYCEKSCNRIQLDNTVNIHVVERFLGDMALEEQWELPNHSPPTNKKILVVGAGPAGLSAAYHLTLLGHTVTIYETLPVLGGMMYVGIPDFRLPQDILARETQRIIDMGINLKLNYQVNDLLWEKKRGDFDAVFLAIGAHRGRILDCPTINPPPILDAIQFLRGIRNGQLTVKECGNNLIIFGGSNTAIDVARSARRIGVKSVTIVYHRSRERMTAFPNELAEAIEEGVKIRTLRNLSAIDKRMAKFHVVELDIQGNPQPTGETEIFDCDMLVFSVGQKPESEFLQKVPNLETNSKGFVIADDRMMTGHPGIFAGGDMLPFDQSITVATGHGKRAARHIDAYLRNTTFVKPPKNSLVTASMMPLWFGDTTEPVQQPILEADKRLQSFAEVTNGVSKEEALYEAKRCLSCGNCFECDGCYSVCPEKAITKLGHGKRYHIEQDLCSGCRACQEQCPCAAIKMK